MIRADPRGLRQLARVRAAQLHRQRLFGRIMAQQMPLIAMDQRPCGDHFSIKQRVPAQPPVQIAAMPVSPVHHRRDGEYFIGVLQNCVRLLAGRRATAFLRPVHVLCVVWPLHGAALKYCWLYRQYPIAPSVI